MNLRTTTILYGLLCGSILTFGLFQWLEVRTPAMRRNQARAVFPRLRELVKPPEFAGGSMEIHSNEQYKQFDRITIQRPARDGHPAENIEIVRRGSQWQIVAPHSIRTDTAAVHLLIDQLALAERDSLANLPDGLAAYGLDQPTHVIRLFQGATAHTLSIGKPGLMIVDPTTKQPRPLFYYVVGSEQPDAPATVSAAAIPQLLAPLDAFRERRVFPQAARLVERSLPGAATPQLKGMELGGTERSPLKLTVAAVDPRTGFPSRWKFVEPRLGEANLNTVTTIAGELAGLRIDKNEDFLRDGVTDPTALDEYGLAPGKAAFAIGLKTGLSNNTEEETLYLGKPILRFTAEQFFQWTGVHVSAQVPAMLLSQTTPLAGLSGLALLPQRDKFITGYYATVGGSGTIHLQDERLLPALRLSVNEFRDRALTRLDLDKLDAIDIDAGPDKLQLRRRVLKPGDSSESEWDLYLPGKGKVNADSLAVKKLIDALNQIDVRDLRQFLAPETPHLGLETPAGVITLWEAGIERDKEGKPTGKEPTFKKDAQPALKLTVSRKLLLLPWDKEYGYAFLKREPADQLPTLLAVPDPWLGDPPPRSPGQPQPPQQLMHHALSELVAQPRLRYRDHALPHIATGQREVLQIERGNVKYALVNTAKPEAGKTVEEVWQLKQPIDAPCPDRAKSFLAFLQQVDAKLLRADLSTPAQWEEHGVGTKPWMKIHVQSFADEKQHREECTVFLGHRTKDTDEYPKHYYARMEFKPREGTPPESNNFLFLVHENWVKPLDLELRDPNIFPTTQNLTPTQAVFTWNITDQGGKPHVIRLQLGLSEERQRGWVWTVLSLTDNGADAKGRLQQADPAKCSQTVQKLFDTLQTPRFLIHDGSSAPEQRLDLANKAHPPALTVELTLSDTMARYRLMGTLAGMLLLEHPPNLFAGAAAVGLQLVGNAAQPLHPTRTLVFGAEHILKPEDHPYQAGTYRLAMASALPHAVFLVHLTKDLEELLKGPEFFQPAASSPR